MEVFSFVVFFSQNQQKANTDKKPGGEIRDSPERDRGGKKSRFKSPAQARSVRAGSVRAASPASRSDSVATGPSAQCTTFTRAVGAGDHSASSRRAASELVRTQDRSPPVCCRLLVSRTRTQIRDSLL